MAVVEIDGADSLLRFKSAYNAAIEDTTRSLRGVHTNAIKKLYARSEQLFRERTGRPPYTSVDRTSTSATHGGTQYRRQARATGRFTFGPGRTFRGNLINENNGLITGVGYPIMSVADARTDGAWRALEFGMSFIRMPAGVWRDFAGNIAPTREPSSAYPVFTPTSRVARPRRSFILDKRFLRDAFDQVVNELDGDYQRIVDRDWRGRFTR